MAAANCHADGIRMDAVDGAALVVNPTIADFNTGEYLWEKSLTDYRETDW
jgi:hypothetical protein